MRKLLILLLLFIVILSFISCRKCEVVGRRIVGTWTISKDNEPITLDFAKNGKLRITSLNYNADGWYTFETPGKRTFKDVHLFIRTYNDNTMDSFTPDFDGDVLLLEPDSTNSPHAFLEGFYERVK
ncbi:MAG TPA: hypothetical protein PKW80_16320 [Bacteroidales bacterium]|nr:hypothetical protein [Bacteroidales bacterium]